jgi:DNA polymerase III subunit delta'
MMYVHETSAKLLTNAAKDLPQAILLHGPDGIGFKGALELLKGGRELFIIEPEKDGKIDREKGSISIETVRGLYDLVRTRTTTPRVIVLEDAERISTGAQNAFLKLLEEPNNATHFVLLAHTPTKLLSTIRSRAQAIELRPISPEASKALLDESGAADATTRSQLLFIAEGLPALLIRLAQDKTLFESRAQIVRDARTFLTGSRYQKLAVAESYREKREQALVLLTDAAKLLKRTSDAHSLQKIGAFLESYDRIAQNGNIRLQLASLVG